MKYLIYSKNNGFYITDSEEQVIKNVCGECGKTDDIVFVYSDEKLEEALTNYFSTPVIYNSDNYLFQELNHIEYIYDLRINMLNYLYGINKVNKELYEELLKKVLKDKRIVIELFKQEKKSYYQKIIKTYQKTKYKK